MNADTRSGAAAAADAVQEEIDEEIAFHIEERARAFKDLGHGEREARALAAARFGNVARIRKACRTQRLWKSTMLQRLHLALTLLLLLTASVLGARSFASSTAQEAKIHSLRASLDSVLSALPTDGGLNWVVNVGVDPRTPAAPARTDLSSIVVGDTLEVVDQDHIEDVMVMVDVTGEGMILLPKIGWIDAVGRSLETLEAELNEAYAIHFRDPPRIAVMLDEAAPTVVEPDPKFAARPGDTIRLYDIGNPGGLNLEQTLRPDGTVLLPEIGRVTVKDTPRGELEAMLTERYAIYFAEAPKIFVLIERAETATSPSSSAR